MSVVDELRDGKVGRVPVWALGLIIAGGIILFVVVRNRVRKNTGDASPESPVGTQIDSVDGLASTDFADQISGNFPSNVMLAPLPARPSTNAQWQIAVFDYLAGLGKDPQEVQRAVADYLAGKALSAEQWALINIATANTALSLPPEGVNLAPIPNPGTGGGGGGGGGGTTNPPPTPQFVTARAGADLYSFAQSVNVDFVRLFGRFTGDPSALNPSARGQMAWQTGPPGADYKIPVFKSDYQVKVY